MLLHFSEKKILQKGNSFTKFLCQGHETSLLDLLASFLYGMMAYLYLQKKVAGIILDGLIRDIDEIAKWDFPVYCTGTTPRRPLQGRPR